MHYVGQQAARHALPHPRTLSGTLFGVLSPLPGRVLQGGITPPARVVIGKVVGLRAELNGFEPDQ